MKPRNAALSRKSCFGFFFAYVYFCVITHDLRRICFSNILTDKLFFGLWYVTRGRATAGVKVISPMSSGVGTK